MKLRINSRYHAVRPAAATLSSFGEKLQWHMMHHVACNCRPIPLGILKVLKKRKLPC